MGYGKYAFCIADPINKKIIDIIPNRRTNWLRHYFNKVSNKERKRVKTIIIDLWAPYRNIIKDYFPNATIIADRFHYVRHLYWAFNDVRVRVMKSFHTSNNNYKFLKAYWKVLFKSPLKLSSSYRKIPYSNIDLNEYGIQDLACSIDSELEEAISLKDYFQVGIEKKYDSYDEALKFINSWIMKLRDSNLKEFNKLATTFINWKDEIINSIIHYDSNNKRYSNGFIEGVNNFIKVIRRLAFGFRDFDRFRKKVMVSFNNEFYIRA